MGFLRIFAHCKSAVCIKAGRQTTQAKYSSIVWKSKEITFRKKGCLPCTIAFPAIAFLKIRKHLFKDKALISTCGQEVSGANPFNPSVIISCSGLVCEGLPRTRYTQNPRLRVECPVFVDAPAPSTKVALGRQVKYVQQAERARDMQELNGGGLAYGPWGPQ